MGTPTLPGDLVEFQILILSLWGGACKSVFLFSLFYYFDVQGLVVHRIFRLLCRIFGACKLLVAAYGTWLPDQGWNLGPLDWECGL